MRKHLYFCLLLLISLLLLSSCELQSQKENKRFYFFTVALDYEETSLSTLRGTVNDQEAIISQLEFLSRVEGSDFVSISYVARGGNYTRREKIYSNISDETVSYYNVIGKSTFKSSILEDLARLEGKMNEEDIFIFYYAGHGADGQNEEDSWLNGAMVLSDIYFPSVGDWKDVASNMKSILSIGELKTALEGLPAYKLVILDSCYSGSLAPDDPDIHKTDGIIAAFTSLGTSGSHGNRRSYFITASGADRLSYEDSRYGLAHGIFSGSLLEALGYSFHSDGVEGPGMPTWKRLSVSLLFEKLNTNELVELQSPQLNEFYVDLVLFSL